MPGLADVFNDPERLKTLSSFLLSFGQGVTAANERGLSPFAAIASGFGAGGQGLDVLRRQAAIEEDRQLRRQMMGQRLAAGAAELEEARRGAGLSGQIARLLGGGAAGEASTLGVAPAAGGVTNAPVPPANLTAPGDRARLAALFAQLPKGRGLDAAISLSAAPEPDKPLEVNNQLVDPRTGQVVGDYRDPFIISGNKVYDRKTLKVRADLSDPSTEIVELQGDDGATHKFLVNKDTGARIADLGVSGGARNLTVPEVRINGEIDEARRRLAARGISRDDALRLTQKTSETGLPNDEYDAALADLVERATKLKYGERTDSKTYQRWQDWQHATAAAGSQDDPIIGEIGSMDVDGLSELLDSGALTVDQVKAVDDRLNQILGGGGGQGDLDLGGGTRGDRLGMGRPQRPGAPGPEMRHQESVRETRRGNAILDHFAARGDMAIKVPAAQRTEQHWEDIEAFLVRLGTPSPRWEQAERELMLYRSGGR